jgi:DNA-binding NtrC family response regulator
MASTRFVVADGDPERRAALVLLLRNAGYEAVPVKDGTMALEAIDAVGPEIVIIDLSLPGLDDAAFKSALDSVRPMEPGTLEEAERLHVAAVLQHTNGNRSRAAKLLDISRSTIIAKIRRYGLR